MALEVPICQDGVLTPVANVIECVGGTWVTYDGSGLPGAFDLSALDVSNLMEFYGAGFMVAATPILFAVGVTFVLKLVKESV